MCAPTWAISTKGRKTVVLVLAVLETHQHDLHQGLFFRLWAGRDRSEKALALILCDSVMRNRLLQNPVPTICVSRADPAHTHIPPSISPHFYKRASQVALPSGKEPACQCRRHKRHGFDPWVWKIPGGGHGHPLQYSCLENAMGRGAWRATVHGVAKRQT